MVMWGFCLHLHTIEKLQLQSIYDTYIKKQQCTFEETKAFIEAKTFSFKETKVSIQAKLLTFKETKACKQANKR